VGGSDRRGETLSDDNLLEVDSLVAGYQDPVVGPVSFTLAAGEIVGLAGPNGSGKSTLLGALIGTTRVFSGAARRRPRIRVSIQSQAPVRLAEMPVTGAEFLRITGAHHHAIPPRLGPYLGQRLDRLSGGQYQLLNVWACLGSPAELVILDEPTNNMDPKAVLELGELLVESREKGRGVLVVSHEHELLEKVTSRMVEIRP
jgi:zinc transport system ATP-binding protein